MQSKALLVSLTLLFSVLLPPCCWKVPKKNPMVIVIYIGQKYLQLKQSLKLFSVSFCIGKSLQTYRCTVHENEILEHFTSGLIIKELS